ncbi:MAG: FAD binding domain-containing protein [Oligoflexia bacterium]|nr:FAD binding domain-containing protein [Oligoflexia bacterium]MBF0366671.1 FAD binding domain-containing protein [Oligoflexia bacterium]
MSDQQRKRMRDYVLLYVNGVRRCVRGKDVFLSLSDYLRQELLLTGTKVVCAEGDCGACTTIRMYSDFSEEKKLTVEMFDSCIAPLYLLDCTNVVTIEGAALGEGDERMSPVQTAMMNSHGSQCGFCTPGFVMAMTAIFASKQLQLKQGAGASLGKEKENLTEAEVLEVREGLVGNLCRCTGYVGIIDAAKSVPWRLMPFLLQHQWSVEIENDLLQHRAIPLKVVSKEEGLGQEQEKTLYAPVEVEEAVALKREQQEKLSIFSGATDLGVQINKGRFAVKAVLNLSNIATLFTLARDEERAELIVGAKVSLSRLQAECKETIPELYKHLNIFASPQIKNLGTLVGNLANASPIGDTIPFLLAVAARVEVMGAAGRRVILMDEFFLGYKKIAVTADEIITRIFIPIPAKESVLKIYKVSKRSDLDISTISASFLVNFAAKEGVIDKIRVAYGGVAATPLRFLKLENFLQGKSLQAVANSEYKEVEAILRNEASPIADVRGSAEYRADLVVNLFKKFSMEMEMEMERRK